MPAPPSKKPVSVASRAAAPARRRTTNNWLIVAVVVVCFAAVLVFAGWDVFRTSDTSDGTADKVPSTSLQSRDRSPQTHEADRPSILEAANPDTDVLVDDDGETLWASPTAGVPLKLAYLPPGVQIIIALRPAALIEHPEWEKVYAALGPTGQQGIRYVHGAANVSPDNIEQLIFGLRATSDGTWQTTLVVKLVEQNASELIAEHFPKADNKEHNRNSYWVQDEQAYYVPEGEHDKVLVIAPAKTIADVIDLHGEPPPLRRDVERLLTHTDADRHFTVIAPQNFLFSDGQSIFAGELARLRAPLFGFLGDELSAAALSLHWDDNFFVELTAAPLLDTSPQRTATILAERVKEMPDRLEDYVVSLDSHPYGRRVMARFPGMVRKLATYTRTGFDADHATLRAYLPVVAGHNLLMGAELTLLERPGGAVTNAAAHPATSPAASSRPTAEEGLKRVTTLAFARDTLEAALEQLSQNIGVEIDIIGPDLQSEGITKNQSFGVEIKEKPASEILIEILRLANPDKTATGPHDERQKLVYVIAPHANGEPPQILITTRARVAERGDELPAAFRGESPE